MVETTDQDIVQDLEGMTNEAKDEAWANWVRSEISAALNIYLPISFKSDINVGYYPHIIETLETGDVKDPVLKGGVVLTIDLKFEKPIDITKPRID
jgi:hypothetical protein